MESHFKAIANYRRADFGNRKQTTLKGETKMNRTEILETLSEVINLADEKQLFEIGDKLFEIITALKEEWNIEE